MFALNFYDNHPSKINMAEAIITLAYKQIIDALATGAFEQQVLNASYQEYLLKSQAYNPGGKFKTFTELKTHDGRANSLHYKSGFAVDGFISTLKKQIPIFQTTLCDPIAFTSYQFEVIESDINNKLLHKVAISYFTPPLILHSVIGNYILLSYKDDSTDPGNKLSSTFLVLMQQSLSINAYESN